MAIGLFQSSLKGTRHFFETLSVGSVHSRFTLLIKISFQAEKCAFASVFFFASVDCLRLHSYIGDGILVTKKEDP